jgi:hypothetical protein
MRVGNERQDCTPKGEVKQAFPRTAARPTTGDDTEDVCSGNGPDKESLCTAIVDPSLGIGYNSFVKG